MAFTVCACCPGRGWSKCPGAIVTLEPSTGRFRITHQLDRGTRPLNITATPEGKIYFGEYFDNGARDAVNIYGSDDGGASWHVVHTFPKGAIRHVHNIAYDQWQDCLWVLTGDWGSECRIMRASKDFSQIEGVQSGSQNCRAVAIVCTAQSIYFATDNPREANYICRLDWGWRPEPFGSYQWHLFPRLPGRWEHLLLYRGRAQ